MKLTYGNCQRTVLEALMAHGVSQDEAMAIWNATKLNRFEPDDYTVSEAVKGAVIDMADPNGIFCSAGFYSALNAANTGAPLSQTKCEEILIQHPRVVRLKCGTMWMLLPGTAERYAD